MAPDVDARLRWPGWRALGERSWAAGCWLVAIAAGTAAFHVAPSGSLLRLHLPSTDGAMQTAVEVVPAIVIAIFVFAVGTLFVVAQVVPQARGTRAVAMLRKRYLAWTISPALVLAPLSALVLVLDRPLAADLAATLLIGVAIYLFASTACLLAVLGEATDPDHFSALLKRHYRSALETLRRTLADNDKSAGVGFKEERAGRRPLRPNAQAAVDDLYDVVRTLRGWTRSAATTGDSRELHVALETTLELMSDYADVRWAHRRDRVPTSYWLNAKTWRTNPLYPDVDLEGGSIDKAADAYKYVTWDGWVPPVFHLTFKPEGQVDNYEIPAEARKLGEVWVTNEVGRAVVRAVEFATSSKSLLDRDRGRLVGTMRRGTRLLAEKRMSDAGVMIGALIELGLGARRCPAEEVDWHFEPLASLAALHLHFTQSEPIADARESLLVGSGAGILLVADAIAASRLRMDLEQRVGADWDGILGPPFDTASSRTARQLRSFPGLSKFRLSDVTCGTRAGDVSCADLAKSEVLEPSEFKGVNVANPTLIDELVRYFATLAAPATRRDAPGDN